MKNNQNLMTRYRMALKTEVSTREKKHGRGLKSLIAKKAKISRAYLGDIAMERKPGSEEVRHRIAEALGYRYEEFQELGRLLLNGMDIYEARAEIERKRSMQPVEDGVVEKILEIWLDFTGQEREKVYQYAREVRFNAWMSKKGPDNFPANKSSRFRFIWKEVCQDSDAEPLYDDPVLDLMDQYKQGAMSDMDVYDNAKKFITKRRVLER